MDTAKLLDIGLDQKTIDGIAKNKKLIAKLDTLAGLASGKASRDQGNLLYAIATKVPQTQEAYYPDFVEYVMTNKWSRVNQVDEAIAFMKKELAAKGASYKIDRKAFEEASGVGINLTKEDYDSLINKAFEANKADIEELGWGFNFKKLLTEIKNEQKWIDSKYTFDAIYERVNAQFGPKPETDGKRPKLNKMKPEEKAKKKINAPKDPEVEATSGKDIFELIGRDCNIGANDDAILKKHLEFTKGRVVTRFPPEPNGYLHIGHAKAIRFNFTVAKENGGICYLRFDDTNPVKENHEFIDHIKKNVKWLGYEPWKVTASSDYFQELHDLAVELIKKDKAYVCFQNAEQMSLYRNEKRDSPYRNTSVEENLKLFNMMRQGRFDEGECTLRVKMDMQHANPNMRDFVAYRIRFTDHPHSGDKWCIYPTYDYTHCIVDSLENITHSLCTLEFEIRRESYFQLLKDCHIYKPYVWEYSRLNISNTVLSKRKIETLVNKGLVDGWADPRLLTLEGLRRRGYTPSIINDFCAHLGVARKGNENLTSMKLLEKFARTELDRTAPRTFAVMDPLEIEIVNFDTLKETKFQAPLFPTKEGSETQTYELTKNVYIERSDFCEVHDKTNYGLSPEQMVYLKYGPVLKFLELEKSPDGSISKVKVEALPDYKDKLKGHIHWVSKNHAMTAKCNLYAIHFLEEDLKKLGDKWLDAVNPNSLVVKDNAKIWNLHKNIKVDTRFQFERIGYFVLEESSNPMKKNFVFNRIVELKESKDKK